VGFGAATRRVVNTSAMSPTCITDKSGTGTGRMKKRDSNVLQHPASPPMQATAHSKIPNFANNRY